MIRLQRGESGPYSGPVNTYVIDALPPNWCQARREEYSLVIPNKRRATRLGPNLGATRRAGVALARSGVTPRLCGMTTSRSLRLVSRQSGHRRVDQICVNRPLPLSPCIFPIYAVSLTCVKSSKSVLALAGSKLNRCFTIEHLSPTGS